MKKYSCTYGGTKENFVVINAYESQNSNRNYKEYGVFCVIQNIIQRGFKTKPSDYLISSLGVLDKNTPETFLINNNLVHWQSTIKGDAFNEDYPAEIFFNELLPNALGEYKFLRNLILPEARISDILDYENSFFGQQVDFYIPQIKTVIEVDGYSHSMNNQYIKDKKRDDAFNRNNISVERISAFDIKHNNQKLNQFLNKIYDKLNNSSQVSEYKNCININTNDLRIKYDAVIRLQMCIIDIIKAGLIDLNSDNLNIYIKDSDIDNLEELIAIAYKDISLWSYAITTLLKININFPKINIVHNQNNANIILDFSMFKRYTDEIEENVIYIRNDYFFDKNYYKIQNSDSLQYQININNAKDIKALNFLLKNIYGFDEFREGQLPIIANTLNGNDTIGILPTGTGKSLCYQITSLLQPGVTLVVAPIISLIDDQISSLKSVGISHVGSVTSVLSGEEKDQKLNEFKLGKYQIFILSPERFQNQSFRNSLSMINKELNFSLAVVDEVHCLSEWGHDFRVSYLSLIRTLHEYCPEATLLGLTATASQSVLEDLKNEFHIDSDNIKALTSMDRKELIFKRIIVDDPTKKFEEIEKIILDLNSKFKTDITKLKGSKTYCGLIFSQLVNSSKTMEGCNDIANYLNLLPSLKGNVAVYSGKLSVDQKSRVQKAFMNNKYAILVCTKAFGMGIDKSNIRYTIHYSLPSSMESFYQEAGRAGRDANKKNKSYCYILYTPEKCSKKTIEEIFNQDTSIDKRKELCRNLKYDLNTNMFLWNINKFSVDEEYQNIKIILEKIYNNNNKIEFSSSFDLNIYQNALYKLSIIGIVNDWTIDYHKDDNGILNVRHIDIKKEGEDLIKITKNKLKEYIQKYDVEFTLNELEKLIQESEKPLETIIKYLLNWVNTNIMYQRLESTKTIMEACAPEVTDQEFRTRLDYYFRFTEKSIIFDNLIYHPRDYRTWFSILFVSDKKPGKNRKPIDKETAKKTLASLQRYIESYRNNTGFMYLDGMLRLLVGESGFSEENRRLLQSFKNIKTMDVKDINSIIENTLLFGTCYDIDGKDRLSQIILDIFPERSKQCFATLSDRYSLSIEFNKSMDKFNNIKKEIKNGLFR